MNHAHPLALELQRIGIKPAPAMALTKDLVYFDSLNSGWPRPSLESLRKDMLSDDPYFTEASLNRTPGFGPSSTATLMLFFGMDPRMATTKAAARRLTEPCEA